MKGCSLLTPWPPLQVTVGPSRDSVSLQDLQKSLASELITVGNSLSVSKYSLQNIRVGNFEDFSHSSANPANIKVYKFNPQKSVWSIELGEMISLAAGTSNGNGNGNGSATPGSGKKGVGKAKAPKIPRGKGRQSIAGIRGGNLVAKPIGLDDGTK